MGIEESRRRAEPFEETVTSLQPIDDYQAYRQTTLVPAWTAGTTLIAAGAVGTTFTLGLRPRHCHR